MATRDEIKKAIESKKSIIQSDNPQVEIARMNIEAVGKLADDHNDVFSQLQKDAFQDETLDYSMAINFAINPLSGLEERLAKRGIVEKVTISHDLGDIEEERAITIKIPMFVNFLKEFLVRRHCLNRSRVSEYIEALDKANGKENVFRDENKKMGILQRMG
jgi:hypothetical protein